MRGKLPAAALLAMALSTSGLCAGGDEDRVIFAGSRHPLARPELEIGPSDPALPMENVVLLLRRQPGADREIDRLISSQRDPASPRYRSWISAQEFGRRFGPAESDLRALVAWLEEEGLRVEDLARCRGWINVSGTAAQFDRALRADMRDYLVDGRIAHANSRQPSAPRAAARALAGVLSLHSFRSRPLHHRLVTGAGGEHSVAPGDFARIYDVAPLYSNGTKGSGQSIAIVGRTDISLDDVRYFRSTFGLPARDPEIVHNGPDPGNLGDDGSSDGLSEEIEADLDVEWAGAVAPNSTVRLIVSKSTATTDGVDLSAQYIVDNDAAPIASVSFGLCEADLGSAVEFYRTLWATAAAEGITVLIASGDSGAAGCQGGNDDAGTSAAVSGLSSTPYNVSVGGTQFDEGVDPSRYWSPNNDPATQASAISYIPEIAWNESGSVPGGFGLWAGGGGASAVFDKPSWQSGPGVPADGKRDVPDVSLSSASHDGYLIVQRHSDTATGLLTVGGTSAAAPAMAGLMALVLQRTGSRQGLANPSFYHLASQQAQGGLAVFHDVTSGGNGVPGVAGFSCGTGFDLATGLGSVDAALLVQNWSSTPGPDFLLSASPASLALPAGTSVTTEVQPTVLGGFSSAIALSASGMPAGIAAAFSPAGIPAPGTASSILTVSADASAAPGSFSLAVEGSGAGITRSIEIPVTVAPGNGARANLAPARPDGWSAALVISRAAGGVTDDPPYAAGTTLFASWAVVNSGTVATTLPFQVALAVDGATVGRWRIDPPLSPGGLHTSVGNPIGPLATGVHSVALTVDSTGAIPESDETDNRITRSIGVGLSTGPVSPVGTPAPAPVSGRP
jgi:pseudomonalisin